MKPETKQLLTRSLFFILYLVIGMVAFRFLEEENERHQRTKAKEAIDRMKKRFNISEEEMLEFVNVVSTAARLGYTEDWLQRWTYIGSLFFSGTVVTTIGYGFMAPSTFYGRLFCIFYALFGIPVTWLMLTSIGKTIVEHIGKSLKNNEIKPTTTKFNVFCLLAAIALSASIMFAIAVAGIFVENWTFFEGFYFAFISLTTIGFGDYVPMHPNFDKTEMERSSFAISLFVVFCLFLFSFGLAATTSVLISIRKIMESHTLLGFESLYSSDASENEEDRELEEQSVSR